METSDKIAAVHRYVEAFATSDMNIIRELYADNAIVEDPVGTEPKVGMAAILEFYEAGIGAGAKLELTGSPRVAGNSVAFPFRVQWGEMQIEIIDVFDFDESGKVCHMKAYWGPENTLS